MKDEVELDNQSIFIHDVEESSPPPETQLSPEEQVKYSQKQGKRKKIMMLGGAGLIFLVVLAVISSYFLKPTPQTMIFPTPTPIPNKDFTKMEKELSRLEGLVNLADPSQDTLILPPIDENLTF